MRRSVLAFLLAAGCSSKGPGTVSRDRIDYGQSITDSWKRQTLLNVVKLRYADAPLFLDVGQIVAGYTWEIGGNAGATLDGADTVSLGAAGKYTDRPTVTYTPLTGAAYLRALMTPLPPTTVFSAIEAGWPSDLVMGIAVESINGLRNERANLGGAVASDERFQKVTQLLSRLQRTGGFSLRVQKGEGADSLLTLRAPEAAPDAVADAAEIRQLLQLDPEAREFRLSFGQVAADAREVAVVTRSMLTMMLTLAGGVQVPEQDVKEGRASPSFGEARPGQFAVKSAKSRPADAFVAVKYRDQWFWIDDHDFATKRRFALLMLLFSLADTSPREGAPVLTIPA